MKPLILSTNDISGGAGKAAFRLCEGLRNQNIDSQMLVVDKTSDEYFVSSFGKKNRVSKAVYKAFASVDSLPLKFYRNPSAFSLNWFPSKVSTQLISLAPSLLNLHWINEAFVSIEEISQFSYPLVVTLHDMWFFTGGCHYSGGCGEYQSNCGRCPILRSKNQLDLSRLGWLRKKRLLTKRPDITFVAPSRWLQRNAQKSSLLKMNRVEFIPNGLDVNLFKPFNQNFARQALGLPQDRKLILFGAMRALSDERKGYQYLETAIKELPKFPHVTDIDLVVFGASSPESPPNYGVKIHYLKSLKDEISVVLAYSAADVFIAPSLEDNLPNTLLEAMSCGVPCVAFNTGGIPEIIDHKMNGYLAKLYDSLDLAKGIIWILEDQARFSKLSQHSREKAVRNFASTLQSQRYLNLFEEIVIKHKI